MQALPPLTFAGWTRALTARGYDVLPASHAVPVSLWLRDDSDRRRPARAGCCTSPPAAPGCASPSYRPTDLTTLMLRAACDCAEHRQAGATGRVVLNPGAEPAGGARARRRRGLRLARPRGRPAPAPGDRRPLREPARPRSPLAEPSQMGRPRRDVALKRLPDTMRPVRIFHIATSGGLGASA